jgi:hypothetical protein
VSERENIKFHNVKFDSIIDDTLPEDRFGEFIKPRIAESKDNLEEMEKEGKVVMQKVTLKNAQGYIIKQYQEPVK